MCAHANRREHLASASRENQLDGEGGPHRILGLASLQDLQGNRGLKKKLKERKKQQLN